MSALSRFAILFLAFALQLPAADWYVSPTGTKTGSGTIDSPWDLATAIGSDQAAPATKHAPSKLPPSLKSGDTVYLRGGVYVGAFDSHISGVTLRSHPGEHAIIDLATPTAPAGGRRFYCWGPDATYQDLEFRSSGKRKTGQTGPWPSEIDLGGLVTYGDRIWYVGLVCHDLEGTMSSQSGGGMVDCVIYNCGWLGGDNAHGHGAYVQNRADRGELKLIAGNVSFGNFGYGIHAYGTNPGATGLLNKITLDGNVCFDNGGAAGKPYNHFPNLFIGGQMEARDIVVTGNATYSTQRDNVVRFGYPWGPANKAMTLVDNVFACGRLDIVKPFNPMTATGNLVVGTIATLPIPAASNEVRATGTGTKIVVRKSTHNPRRALVTVFNWAKSPTVSVDLSSVLTANQSYTIHAATNLTHTWADGTYSGPVTLSMAPRELPRPTGYSERAPVVLSEEFGCFIVTAGETKPTPDPDPEPDPDPQPEPEPGEFRELKLFRGPGGRIYIEENGVKKPL